MSHTSNSKNDRTWLKKSHLKRSNRSIELGKQAIDLLVKKGEPVTYKTVTEISKTIDPEGKGIHSNTIRTNEQLYDYYKQHSLTYKQKDRSKNMTTLLDIDIDFRKLKPNRNFENAQRKYMKLSKKELVQRLILAEQYIAENNSKWIANYFEMYK